MSYEIKTTKKFEKNIKRLGKKYATLKLDFAHLLEELKSNPLTGVDLGNNLRKVRMAIAAKGKGKSGGARVITHNAIITVEEGVITLLTIYDKSEYSSISDKELMKLLAEL